jgi:uncharacterized protein YdiU (UPF0061 family)
MAENSADFTLTFRSLCDAALGTAGDGAVRDLFVNPLSYDEWALRWRQRLDREPQDANARSAAMRRVNPAFIPRNYRVEAVIEAAVANRDFSLFEEMLKVLSNPYEDQPAFAHYAEPPPPSLGTYQTFCGT